MNKKIIAYILITLGIILGVVSVIATTLDFIGIISLGGILKTGFFFCALATITYPIIIWWKGVINPELGKLKDTKVEQNEEQEDNEKIKIWLKDNSEKPEQEIERFLFSKMNSDDLESWQKHYFLEELKSPVNGFSEKVLKVINNIQKEVNGVPMSKRFVAFFIDSLILSLLYWVLSSFLIIIGINDATVSILFLLSYFSYFYFSIYKFKTTLGLYFLGIKIKFDDIPSSKLQGNLSLRIISREIIFLFFWTGIGFIFYLIYGPYWDKMTSAHVVWRKEFNNN